MHDNGQNGKDSQSERHILNAVKNGQNGQNGKDGQSERHIPERMKVDRNCEERSERSKWKGRSK